MRVIADHLHGQRHPVALELLLRLVIVALAAAAILGLLPLVAEVAA